MGDWIVKLACRCSLEGLEMSAALRRWIWFGGLYVTSIIALGAVTLLVCVTLSHFK
jgi:hypothetical protein